MSGSTSRSAWLRWPTTLPHMAEVYTKEGLRLSGCTMYISADEKAVMKELVEAFPGKVTLGPVSCFVDNWELDADDGPARCACGGER